MSGEDFVDLSRLQSEGFARVNFIETLFTQWRSSVGVLNPSPLKTWPKCPPQAAQVISVLLPSGSGWKIRFVNCHTNFLKAKAKINIYVPRRMNKQVTYTHRAIYSSRQVLKEGRPTAAGVEFGRRLVKWRVTTSTIVNPFFIKLVIFPSASLPANHKHLIDNSTLQTCNKRQNSNTTNIINRGF